MPDLILNILLFGVGFGALVVILFPFSPMTIDLVLIPRETAVRIYRNRHILWTVALLALAVLLLRGAAGIWGAPDLLGTAAPFWFWLTIGLGAVMAMMFWSGYVPYVMTPPEKQQILSPDQADDLLDPDTHVLGLYHNGEARAYPRNLLARPHYLNDEVGGKRVTISYCILCNSGVAFEAELEGRPLNLRALTATNNNIIYFEPDRGNFIQQLDGEVFEGPDAGKGLKELPLLITSWREWKALHPDTRVCFAPPLTVRDRIVNGMLNLLIPLEKLAKRDKPWHRTEKPVDPRLPAMSFVIGVERNRDCCAYPVDTAKREQVIQDTLGGEPIAVLYDAQHDLASVFSRELNNRTLTLESAPDPAKGIVVRDQETGSLWDIHGTAREGELKGQQLTEVPHFNKLFWFAWAHFKPDTRLYGEESSLAGEGVAQAS